ncbi:MAG: hypothetical protein ACI97A_003213 [Planctomycetota bacterium]
MGPDVDYAMLLGDKPQNPSTMENNMLFFAASEYPIWVMALFVLTVVLFIFAKKKT